MLVYAVVAVEPIPNSHGHVALQLRPVADAGPGLDSVRIVARDADWLKPGVHVGIQLVQLTYDLQSA